MLHRRAPRQRSRVAITTRRRSLKRRVIRVNGNHGPDLAILRKISSRLTPVPTHQLDSSGLQQHHYRFIWLKAENFSAIKIPGLVSGAASANRSSGYTDLGRYHRVLRRRFLNRVPRRNGHCPQNSYRQLSPGLGGKLFPNASNPPPDSSSSRRTTGRCDPSVRHALAWACSNHRLHGSCRAR